LRSELEKILQEDSFESETMAACLERSETIEQIEESVIQDNQVILLD